MKIASAAFLLVLGLIQMVGDVTSCIPLKGVGGAWGASPAPKVFSAVEGYETFSASFALEWLDHAGEWHTMPIDSKRYARLKGPYNRRNVYGALLSYGPLLSTNPHTSSLFEMMFQCGFRGALLEELGLTLDEIAEGPWIKITPDENCPHSDVCVLKVEGNL